MPSDHSTTVTWQNKIKNAPATQHTNNSLLTFDDIHWDNLGTADLTSWSPKSVFDDNKGDVGLPLSATSKSNIPQPREDWVIQCQRVHRGLHPTCTNRT
jgi:hypothetical protein